MVAITIPPTLTGWGLSTFEISVADCGSTVRGWARGVKPEPALENTPIFVLLHGYPQTWRHVIKLLPKSTRLFIPDLPGYGHSSPSQTGHDKATIGQAILSALSTLLSPTTTAGSIFAHPIILIGHDRGARICHRLVTDATQPQHQYSGKFNVLGTVLMDIVPTLTQWKGMSNPSEAEAYFHWPFLANVDLATEMILSMGADTFIRRLMHRWRGDGEQSVMKFEADDAMEIYERPFRQLESVVRSSCLDYQAGAREDVEMQRMDQEEGRKMRVPVLVIYSKGMGKRFDVDGEWREWVDEEESLNAVEMGAGVGHFVAEEDPEGVVEVMDRWLKGVY